MSVRESLLGQLTCRCQVLWEHSAEGVLWKTRGQQGQSRVLSQAEGRGGGLGKELECFMSTQRRTGQPRAIRVEAVEAHCS